MTNTNFEKLLFQALMESADENNQRLLEGFEESKPHIFSESYRKRMYRDLKNAGINPRGVIDVKFNVNYGRGIASAAAVFIVFTGLSAAVPQVRAAVWKPLIQWIDSRINIFFSDTSEKTVNADVFPKYIPDGYEKVYENIGENNADIFYSDGNSYINFSFYTSSVTFSIDDRIDEYTLLTVNGSQAYFFKNNGLNTLLWQDGKYIYELTAQSDDVDLLQIAESVYDIQST